MAATGIRQALGGESPLQESEKVIILAPGEYGAATYTLPDNLTWRDFEGGVKFTSTVLAEGYIRDEATLDVEDIEAVSDGSQLTTLNAPFGASTTTVNVNKVNDTQFSVSGIANNGRLYSVIGYRKKYTTNNLAKTVILTAANTSGGTFSGDDIQNNQRYVIDVATVFGSEFVESNGDVKNSVSVIVEVDNDSGQGQAGYGDPGIDSGRGVKATKFGSNIIVQTGSTGLIASSGDNGNPFGIASVSPEITALQCRVTLINSQQYSGVVS